MHIYFSGIGGSAIGPLAMIALQASYSVSGSDKQSSRYIDYLTSHGITNIHIGQSEKQIAEIHKQNPIDWFVYSSAVAIENPDAPELKFCQQNNIKTSKRDDLLNKIISDKKLKLIAIAGTHGKTTTTAMAVWLFKQLGVPISYSVGAKISFGEMGEYNQDSEYFIYEADEYDRNFLSFMPYLSIISGLGYDHPDIYPSREEYNSAFRQFLNQSEHAFIWSDDAIQLDVSSSDKVGAINKQDYPTFELIGQVNRENAAIVAQACAQILDKDFAKLTEIMNRFPGLSRRFENISENIYSDYAHTREKIQGALQTAKEIGGENIVVIYEGLHNTRQHFIQKELVHLFDDVKKLYIVPSYRAREDEQLEDLTPEKLIGLISKPEIAEPMALDEKLKSTIQSHTKVGDLVLCLSAGGGGSLDEWLRQEFN